MSATADRPAAAHAESHGPPPALARAEGLELLGEVSGSGYKDGAALVRRADGQMVQLGPLMYALLEAIDGERDHAALAAAMSERLGRRLDEEHVVAPRPRSSPSRACSPAPRTTRRRSSTRCWRCAGRSWSPTRRSTKRITAPFTAPLPPVDRAAGARRLRRRLLVRADPQGRRVGDRAGVRQPGAAAARLRPGHRVGRLPRDRPRRRRAATAAAAPGGMGAGHLHRLARVLHRRHRRLPAAAPRPPAHRPRRPLLQRGRRGRRRSASGWSCAPTRCCCSIALQLLEMVKQLSPVIRADGYHILSDATGVPDLYAHIGPTLRRLLPRGAQGAVGADRPRARCSSPRGCW